MNETNRAGAEGRRTEAVLASPRVLVAAGEPGTRDLVRQGLEALYRVETAADGREAIEAVRRQAPDLVLTAGSLPRLDGLGLLRALRADPGTRAIPVILLCADDEEEWRMEGLRAGADDHLRVPFGPRELRARVEIQLERARVRSEAASRARAEAEALRASEARFRTFLRRSRDGIIMTDDRGTILEWNEGQAQITGIPASETVGRPIWEVQYRLAPRARRNADFIRTANEKALAGLREGVEFTRDLEDEIEFPDGTPRIVQALLFGLQTDGGLVAGAISRDVTARRRLEEELRESRALLLEAERLARLGHWARDVRTGRTTWSHEVFRLFGHFAGPYEPVPSGARTLGPEAYLASVAPEDRARVAAMVSETLADGETRHLEYRVVTAEGGVHHVAGTIELLRDARGEPDRLVGVVQDITERKALEQALADANRHKDEFLATLSHELRNPLAPIRSSLSVLGRALPGGEQAGRMLAIVERQVAQLTRLVDDLLDVTRISRGKTRLQCEPVELGEIVRRTVEDHRPTFTAGGISLEGRTPSRPLWLKADPARLTQIVGNLLGNAAKFTPSGGRVEVSLEEEGREVVLRVRDTGIGIPPELLDRLFSPFTQADRTLDRSRGGLGLGLALVKGFAELHGGSVSAASEGPGRGAELTVRLPLAVEAMEPVPAPAPAATRPRRVLVIEDNVDAADSLKEVLELDGHQVETAYDGRAGMEKARAFRPEIVLCDIGLPDLSGYEVARALRADALFADTYLVALSGYALPEDLQRAQEAGFDRHLAKPPSLEELEAVVAGAPEAGEEAGAPGELLH